MQMLMIADDGSASIVEDNTGDVVFEATVMGNIWVELSASGSTAHGPALRIRTVSNRHPQLLELKRAEQRTQQKNLHQKGQVKLTAALPPSMHKSSRGRAAAAGKGVQKQSTAGHAEPVEHGVGEAAAKTSGHTSMSSEAPHSRTSGNAHARGISQEQGKPVQRKSQKKANALEEHDSIAAVLASRFIPDRDRGESELDVGLVSAHDQQHLAQAAAKPQLISCDMFPIIDQSFISNPQSVCDLWQAQLRLGKLAAKVEASLTSSERIHRLQTKLQASCVQVAKVQQGL